MPNMSSPIDRSASHKATIYHALLRIPQEGKDQFVVDSDTKVTAFPYIYVFSAFNSVFDPPAKRHGNVWHLKCPTPSYTPALGISIGGQTLHHNPIDLVIRKPIKEYD